MFGEDDDDFSASGTKACSEFWCNKINECDGNHSFSNEMLRWKIDDLYGSCDLLPTVNGGDEPTSFSTDEVVEQPPSTVVDGGGYHSSVCDAVNIPSIVAYVEVARFVGGEVIIDDDAYESDSSDESQI